MISSLENTLQEVVTWQKETFRLSTVKSKIIHLQKEVEELIKTPDSWEEVADIVFLIAGIADELGLDINEIVQRKLTINRERVWSEPDENGVVEHIRGTLVEVFSQDMTPEEKEKEWKDWELRMRLDGILPG